MWDDFPPIYVPSFAMLQSSIPYTIEAPLQPRHRRRRRVRRADIDTDVHEVAIKTSLKYIQDNRNQVIFDQAEVYRRGWAGEPLRDIPVGYVPGWGPEDKYTTTFPRAYVIPAGARQHSAPAAKRLVDLLVASGGRVTQAKAAFTAGGKSYPAGSYILDLHQPKRGLVNSLLEPGIDLTDRVDDLYAGPGGWSQALTWGATVDTLWDELPAVETERVYEGVSVGQLPAGDTDLLLDPQDAEDLLALNALLDQGVKVAAPGRRLGPHPAQRRARSPQAQADQHGVTFKAAPSSWSGATLDKVVVAYNGGGEVRDTLLALGFEGRAVTATTLTTTLTPDVDVLLVGATLNPTTLNAANRAALDAFLARGGGVVGLGTAGSAFSTNAALLTAPATTGAEPRQRRGERRQPRRAGRQRRAAVRVDLPGRLVLEPGRQRGGRAVLRRRSARCPAGGVRAPAPTARPQAAGKASVVRAVAPAATASS